MNYTHIEEQIAALERDPWEYAVPDDSLVPVGRKDIAKTMKDMLAVVRAGEAMKAAYCDCDLCTDLAEALARLEKS